MAARPGERVHRDNLGNLNVLTALIGHQDDIGVNFYRSKDAARPRLLSVDNGLAFGAMGDNPIRFFSSAWSDVRVPLLPSKTVDRLGSVDRARLEPLGVVAQMRLEGGAFHPIPRTPTLDPNQAVRWNGDDVQLGLTAEEITDVDVRLARLLGAIDSEEVQRGRPRESK
ncbi:MAG: hypothetical protein U0414_27380 [Polyangiaceae bacterium]